MKSRRTQQAINTSSLPDIVFMILFFFMAIGLFPPPQAKFENDLIVRKAIELEDTSKYIQIKVGSEGELQLGYEVISIDNLTELIKDREDKKRNIVVLSIDDDAPIGYIKNYVEPAIQKAGISQVRYEVLEEEEVSSE